MTTWLAIARVNAELARLCNASGKDSPDDGTVLVRGEYWR
jgi:hypothetical protein